MNSIILYPHEILALKDGRLRKIYRPIKPLLVPLIEKIAAYNGKPAWQCLDFDVKCPFEPNHPLWVKETLAVVPNWGTLSYAADDTPIYEIGESEPNEKAESLIARYGDSFYANDEKLIPSTHMPREFSRFEIEIKSVEVGRTDEITEDEAELSGFKFIDDGFLILNCKDQLQDWWSTKFHRYPWESAWAWEVRL